MSRGLTLVELVISTVLVSVLLVAALQTVGASTRSERSLHDRRQGHQLARELMSEIIVKDYVDPALCDAICVEFYGTGKATVTLGPESPEDVSGDRSLFDDVDDYHGWTASPPQRVDGTTLDHLAGWTRSATVDRVLPGDSGALSDDEVGVRRVTVKVSRGAVPVSTLVALRTIGPPAMEACCLGDGTCIDMTPDTCTALGGTPQGAGTGCFTMSCQRVPGVLLVVADAGNPIAQELARKALIESHGYRVTLISDHASKADFETALADADVVYNCGSGSSGSVGTKLTAATVGVLNEDIGLCNELRMVEPLFFKENTKTIRIDDNSHDVTSVFGLGEVTWCTSNSPIWMVSGAPAPGVQVLGMHNASDVLHPLGLAVLETGAELYGGGVAAGRRVQLPWSEGSFDINTLNADGQTILKRSLDWAAASGGPGGACVMAVNDIAMGWRMQGAWYYGQATIRITDGDGADVEGATVTIAWSGDISGTSQGVTDAFGTIMLESWDSNRNGGTFTCTVTDVVLSGCTYEPSANVETTDTIIAP